MAVDGWFSVVLSAALLLHVRYVGLLAVCMLLWQMRKLNNLQLVLPIMAAAARFVYSYPGMDGSWIYADHLPLAQYL